MSENNIQDTQIFSIIFLFLSVAISGIIILSVIFNTQLKRLSDKETRKLVIAKVEKVFWYIALYPIFLYGILESPHWLLSVVFIFFLFIKIVLNLIDLKDFVKKIFLFFIGKIKGDKNV